MGFRPECQKDFRHGLTCPYCDGDVEYIGKDVRDEHGISCDYNDVDGRCMKCGKEVRIIESVVTEVVGCYKEE